MIDFQLELLRKKTGLNLEIDESNGYTLNEIEMPMHGQHDVSYYSMGKQDFYVMLHAMNRLLERMELNA